MRPTLSCVGSELGEESISFPPLVWSRSIWRADDVDLEEDGDMLLCSVMDEQRALLSAAMAITRSATSGNPNMLACPGMMASECASSSDFVDRRGLMVALACRSSVSRSPLVEAFHGVFSSYRGFVFAVEVRSNQLHRVIVAFPKR